MILNKTLFTKWIMSAIRDAMKKTLDKLTEAEESHSSASEDNGDDDMEPKSKRTR